MVPAPPYSRAGSGRATWLIGIASLLLAVLPASCSDDDAPSGLAQLTADFTTAEALIEHIRTVLSQVPEDRNSFYDLVYAENEWQRQNHQLIVLLNEPRQILDSACLSAFGQLWSGSGSGRTWPIEAMEIVSNDGSRAMVHCSDDYRDNWPLQLVRIGEEWRVSGYTWEQMPPSIQEAPTLDDLARLLPRVRALHDSRMKLVARIKAGEFATIEEAQRAADEAMEQIQ